MKRKRETKGTGQPRQEKKINGSTRGNFGKSEEKRGKDQIGLGPNC
jgi:hypothetical protein